MGWTKRDIVNQAYEAIGIATYDFDLQPQQLVSAVKMLDLMVAAWPFRIGYAMADPSDVLLDAETGVPDMACEALYSNLALRLGPNMGKTISPELTRTANAAKDALYAIAGTIPRTPLPVVAGQGWKRTVTDRDPFITPSRERIDAGPDAELEFE